MCGNCLMINLQFEAKIPFGTEFKSRDGHWQYGVLLHDSIWLTFKRRRYARTR